MVEHGRVNSIISSTGSNTSSRARVGTVCTVNVARPEVDATDFIQLFLLLFMGTLQMNPLHRV